MPDNSTHGKRKGPHPAPRTAIWAVAATAAVVTGFFIGRLINRHSEDESGFSTSATTSRIDEAIGQHEAPTRATWRFKRPTRLKGNFIHGDDRWPIALSFEPGDALEPMTNVEYRNLSQNITIKMRYFDGRLTNREAPFDIMLRGNDNGRDFTIYVDYDTMNGFSGTATSGTYSLPVELSDENTASATMTLR